MTNSSEFKTGAVTAHLANLSIGREGAFADLVEAVYADLKGIAANRLRDRYGPRANLDTLQPTALVHEAVIKLRDQYSRYENREHFFAIATRLMVRIIIDHQRARLAAKRGGTSPPAPMGDSIAEIVAQPAAVTTAHEHESLRLCQALEELQAERPRAAEVVTLLVMCERTMGEIAEMVGVSIPTVERDWRFAREWLFQRLEST